MERVDLLVDRESVTEADLRPYLGGPVSSPNPDELGDIPDSHGWDVTRTARVLGISRTKLHNLIRQTGLKRPGSNEAWSYDALGRLVKRDVYGTISYYWWDGDNLFAELDAAGQKKAEYSYYPGLDNLHSLVDQDDKVYFAHSDGFGNVVGLVSETKALERRYEYDLKGNLVDGWDGKPFSDRDRARFKGALWMGPEVNLYYMRSRWYDVHSGRFLSEDPIGLQGGINVYAFAGGNPVSGRDPLGSVHYPC